MPRVIGIDGEVEIHGYEGRAQESQDDAQAAHGTRFAHATVADHAGGSDTHVTNVLAQREATGIIQQHIVHIEMRRSTVYIGFILLIARLVW